MQDSNTSLINELLQKASVPTSLREFLERNELGDAELFASLYAGKVAYDHSEKRWYLWRGRYWEADRTAEVAFIVSDRVAAKYLEGATEERRNGNQELSNKFIIRARQLLSRRRNESVMALATSLREIALKGNEWDTPSMLLPVANGIVDLETGTFREGFPEDHVRAYCPVDWYGIDIPSPVWERTIQEIFNGDLELIEFIQRLFGYAITGRTNEQVLPILWGDGANGKSTILDTLAATLGQNFCFSTQADSLMDFRDGDGDSARPFVVALRGKRLVWASEGKEGHKLNAGLVKQLTGDGIITARGLYKDPVTFSVTHKIMLVTNHCPRIPDGDDYAMWRRVLRIPFPVRFMESPKLPNERKIDKELTAKLRKEYSAILAWLVRGCLSWQAQGLNPPKVVKDSTETYREDEDLIGQFIDERLMIGEGYETRSGILFKDYSQWCSEYGYSSLSGKAFGQRMAKRFGQPEHKRTGSIYHGVGLATSPELYLK